MAEIWAAIFDQEELVDDRAVRQKETRLSFLDFFYLREWNKRSCLNHSQ
jgi:hypothetical protein